MQNVDTEIAKIYPHLYFVLEDLSYLTEYTLKEVTAKTKKSDTKKLVTSMLKFNPRLSSNRYNLIIGSEDSIPLPSASCKRILCRKTLHEFKSKERMATEIVRILSDGGMLTIVSLLKSKVP